MFDSSINCNRVRSWTWFRYLRHDGVSRFGAFFSSIVVRLRWCLLLERRQRWQRKDGITANQKWLNQLMQTLIRQRRQQLTCSNRNCWPILCSNRNQCHPSIHNVLKMKMEEEKIVPLFLEKTVDTGHARKTNNSQNTLFRMNVCVICEHDWLTWILFADV